MWQLSLAFVQLHFCTDARSLLGDLVKRYPKSPRATDAKTELKTIAKLPKSQLHQLAALAPARARASAEMQRNVTVTFMVVPALIASQRGP